MRSCSALLSRSSAARSASGRSGLRASVSRFARRPVSGVRSSWPASAAKRRVAAVEACRRASMPLSAPASERTSSGPSSGSGVERSSALVTRAAPACSRASGRTVSVLKTQAARPVSASASSPISRISRRMLATRSSTGASVEKRLEAGVGGIAEQDRQRAPAAALDVDGGEALAVGRGGRGVRHVALPRDDLVAVGDLHERPRAAQQRLSPARAAAEAPRAAARAAQHLGGLLAQLLVDRPAAVALDGGEQQHARDRAADGDRQQRGQRQPRAQAARQPHGRSAQPTPRTVCRVLGSPPASSLRRR